MSPPRLGWLACCLAALAVATICILPSQAFLAPVRYRHGPSRLLDGQRTSYNIQAVAALGHSRVPRLGRAGALLAGLGRSDDASNDVGRPRRSGRLARFAGVVLAPALAALTSVVKPALAYRDIRMSPETRIVAAVLGRFIIPIGLCLYFAVNRRKFALEEAKRVRSALDAEEKKKQQYVEEMKSQGYNLGGVGGSLTKEEEDLLRIVEKGAQLSTTQKPAWVKLLQRAQYSRDVVDGKINPSADTAIMTKKELKRVVQANKQVKDQGFKSE